MAIEQGDDISDVLPCAGKLAFDTPQQARTAATVAAYQRGISLNIYRCVHCGLWHLSSQAK